MLFLARCGPVCHLVDSFPLEVVCPRAPWRPSFSFICALEQMSETLFSNTFKSPLPRLRLAGALAISHWGPALLMYNEVACQDLNPVADRAPSTLTYFGIAMVLIYFSSKRWSLGYHHILFPSDKQGCCRTKRRFPSRIGHENL